MNTLRLYEPRQWVRVWIALAASAVLHCAAIAVAELKREPLSEQIGCILADAPIEGEIADNPEISVPDLIQTPAPSVPPDDSFPDAAPNQPPSPPVRRPGPRLQRIAPVGKAAGTQTRSAKLLALSAPRPVYPYEARRAKVTGQGVVVMTVNAESGQVIAAAMAKSTGSTVLDQATLDAFRRWRFPSGTATRISCPIVYTLTGAAF